MEKPAEDFVTLKVRTRRRKALEIEVGPEAVRAADMERFGDRIAEREIRRRARHAKLLAQYKHKPLIYLGFAQRAKRSA